MCVSWEAVASAPVDPSFHFPSFFPWLEMATRLASACLCREASLSVKAAVKGSTCVASTRHTQTDRRIGAPSACPRMPTPAHPRLLTHAFPRSQAAHAFPRSQAAHAFPRSYPAHAFPRSYHARAFPRSRLSPIPASSLLAAPCAYVCAFIVLHFASQKTVTETLFTRHEAIRT